MLERLRAWLRGCGKGKAKKLMIQVRLEYLYNGHAGRIWVPADSVKEAEAKAFELLKRKYGADEFGQYFLDFKVTDVRVRSLLNRETIIENDRQF